MRYGDAQVLDGQSSATLF